MAVRVSGEIGALRRLMPNLGGPSWACRRLYMAVVRSVVMYGAPVWHKQMATGDNLRRLRQAQRRLAQIAIRGYRTIAYEAACAVAGTLPWDLAAEYLASVYDWRAGLRRRGEPVTAEATRAERTTALKRAFQKWELRIADPPYGRRAVGAIRPVLRGWASRKKGSLAYHTVQILTGHGCFGDYLHGIRREDTTRCHECGAAEDSAQHTLEHCPRWAAERRVLCDKLEGEDLSLPSIIAAMLGSEEVWNAVDSFCGEVMSQKESAERAREADIDAPPERRRQRRGRARADYARTAQ